MCSGWICIAAWGRLGKCIVIQELYCNLVGWMARVIVSQYTAVYCDQQGLAAVFCIAIHMVYCG